MKCLSCNKELVDDPNCENPNSALYTFLGAGPFCEEHYREMEKKDRELAKD